MKTKTLLMLVLALVPLSCSALARMGSPLWKSKLIEGDTLFFIRADGLHHASARLLFVPRSMPGIESANREVTYKPGKDFTWKPGSRIIELTERSRIPFKTEAELYPMLTELNAFTKSKSHPGRGLLFAEGHPFHDLEAVAQYETGERWRGFVPEGAAQLLPRTLTRLRAREPIRLVVLGDSISAGANASAFIREAPFTPAYPTLVARGLEASGASKLTLMNLSVGGMTSSWGVTRIPAVIADKPDLLIIAFGMNDAGEVSPERYAENVRAMVTRTRRALSNCEVILVSSMLANPDWALLHQSRFRAFRNELRKMEGPGVALADVTSFWADVMKRKSFYDLTGNGLNHPNDFGQEIYAQTILQLLRSPAVTGDMSDRRARSRAWAAAALHRLPDRQGCGNDGDYIVQPPSITCSAPVVKADSSLAR